MVSFFGGWDEKLLTTQLYSSDYGMNMMNFRILEAEPIRISSGQIVATSHDLTRNGGLVREFPLFQGNLGW